MPNSPYYGKTVAEWSAITDQLIANHPIQPEEIVETVLKSWVDIFNSKIGSFALVKKLNLSPK